MDKVAVCCVCTGPVAAEGVGAEKGLVKRGVRLLRVPVLGDAGCAMGVAYLSWNWSATRVCVEFVNDILDEVGET